MSKEIMLLGGGGEGKKIGQIKNRARAREEEVKLKDVDPRKRMGVSRAKPSNKRKRAWFEKETPRKRLVGGKLRRKKGKRKGRGLRLFRHKRTGTLARNEAKTAVNKTVRFNA